ncbi:MAG: 30S ribosomal protein S6 [Chthoniobacteraceae bacterium]|nr:30S ribosomal protein S6 [Chthoniobacteraceae bacterium]
MNRYEALLILNVKGGDENVKEIIERLEGDFAKEGAKIESVQKMDRRHFSYVAGKVDSGYYVNFIFEAEAPVLEKLRSKFKLDAEVYRQDYKKLAHKKAAPAA